MIEKLRLKNFRSFLEQDFQFEANNYISGKNGSGKTNILEALSIFSEPIVDIDFSSLIKQGTQTLYAEITLGDGKILSISYDIENQKKKYLINGKSTTKKNLRSVAPSMVSFHPLGMNMMYLGPTKRRDFLDNILSHSYSEYEKILKNYKKIVTSRNKVLKNISEGKSKLSEIDFWNEHFIEHACNIYKYRKKILQFFHSHIADFTKYLGGKVKKIEFKYATKVNLDDPQASIRNYLSKNIQRDILLRKTPIGPHVDDFEIILDDTHQLVDFASRGEVKSVIIGLKFLESIFREQATEKTPVFLIDDLLSELDEIHKDMIFQSVGNNQVFITSIQKLGYEGNDILL